MSCTHNSYLSLLCSSHKPILLVFLKEEKMAEGVLFDLAWKVFEVLGSLTLQEIKLASGVKAELESLKGTVSTIQAVLLDAEKQGSHKLRDVFLDTDDVLDDL